MKTGSNFKILLGIYSSLQANQTDGGKGSDGRGDLVKPGGIRRHVKESDASDES